MLKSFLKSVGGPIGVGILIGAGIAHIQDDEKTPFRAYFRAKEISNKTVKNKIESIRLDDVEWIKSRFDREPSNFGFGVVEGPSGIGKSVAILTAARDFKGVLEFGPIFPKTSLDDILNDVCREITGRPGPYFKNKQFMKKVVDKYIEINKRSPIIILDASERKINEPSAHDLSLAARILSTEFSLNVLIDCQENALLVRENSYETVLEMEPMSNEMMRKLPEFQSLFELLKSQGNEEVVLAVCGGVPILLNHLLIEISQLNGEKGEKKSNNVVIGFVMHHLFYAKRNIIELERTHPKMKDVLEMFKDKEDPKTKKKVRGVEFISIDMLPDGIFKQGELDLKNVFRRSIKSYTFIPANGATSILLRNGGEMDFDKVKQTVLSWPEYKQI